MEEVDASSWMKQSPPESWHLLAHPPLGVALAVPSSPVGWEERGRTPGPVCGCSSNRPAPRQWNPVISQNQSLPGHTWVCLLALVLA